MSTAAPSGAPRRPVIVATGVANTASVQAALRRLGAEPVLSQDPEAVRTADQLVLPGVGAFGAAMQTLRERGLEEALRERLLSGRPTLTICLGLQLLCKASEESPGAVGIGLIDASLGRFGAGLRVPQMGWNRVEPTPGARLLTSGSAYFANSYRLAALPPGWEGATSDHGGPFVAALERGALLACQFHPELSGAWGQALLGRWLC